MPERRWELPLPLLLLGLGLRAQGALPPPCESRVYCRGELLHQVQMAKLYPDDKQFVDMSLSAAPEQVLRSFGELAAAHNHSVPGPRLRAFVQQHFRAAGQELEPWAPEDWHGSPRLLQRISDARLRAWAGQLHQIWRKLGKKIKPEVLSRPERFSLIYSPHPFIVPGGRFLEFYYWDSYWVMEGLLLSEMTRTVEGMLRNFLSLVKTYGHVPNGGRVYYLQRSQPPLLTLMMDRYLSHTYNVSFLRENIETLALELDFWAVNRTVSVSVGGKSYALNRYHVPYGGPRPESYSKDTELADTVPAGHREALWAELKAGAESGWDFSSRWLVGGPDPDLLSSIRTSKLVPVDLNAFLCQAEELMSKFYLLLGNASQAARYRNLRAQRLAAMQAVLWDEQKGAWFDYDLEKGKNNLEFYPSNLTPLWAGCFSGNSIPDKALKYLEDSQVLTYRHGIPTSLVNTGQQWDSPNGWAPLQDLVIRGLAQSSSPRTQEVAFQLAQNWIRTNFDVYSHKSAMYEKYDVVSGGQPGGGGEYDVQEGFGWTNGVALMLLDRYGDRLSAGAPRARQVPGFLLATLLLGFLPQCP
ncbi:LOW QUALITY PROTEIN: trehalase [Perognathus longimembris pacificus]|uniref:LOW QUALITY PROTEIN: trehalase n=1 Tax=Perognathus longimembris pacificus TaxID=214514 RepID=UPI00201A15FA|nr:LOW QUALITY PROTEIN: trehalase [Perognathus longimembris pacificus]